MFNFNSISIVNDFLFSDVEDIELQVIQGAKELGASTTASAVQEHSSLPRLARHSSSVVIEAEAEEAAAVAAAASGCSIIEQHCDVKVDVHRKNSSASSEAAPAPLAVDFVPSPPAILSLNNFRK